MSSLFRVLGAVIAAVGVSGLVAAMAGDVGVGLIVFFAIPVVIVGGIILHGLTLGLIDLLRGAPRLGGNLAKTANRGVFALSGFDIRSALRRVAKRWKESK